MADKINDEIIEYVSILAKLELTQKEREQARKDMGRMLACIEKLNELDTTGVEPMSHVFPEKNVFREDEVTGTEAVEEILRNAPCRKDDMFVVPKTFG
ncbi:Asp-tRNA(Asn)/Glu-tRNA(Gln) amidotransferase subunit GatC [Acetatifactor muris]|jgi:aspartyl-tRNA(Asn)/glutamyl-tRNA(Gln) amidotransferase subunit C|uniref:Asp-tRNA(Asn)/Glu-tRNA(Gln) amidotransferase subunit GatC n=1 Tax=Acetatifactor muris TaxID=879566 RepID=UPI0023F01E11|nr:Asp-tRNA(Asn)/Glu-tRNA(Gln) amidotransferase subunit GatC [Acetatifactor muris]MCI8801121.1 Asp-tRNA(Asn)/Glu-tRNA(Gln) amidotransferase subunit GatC [Lachnospiraceae bacterium]